jgi:hypothetical protein
VAGECAGVLATEPQAKRRAGERLFAGDARHHDASEIAVAVMHRDQRHAREQEGECEPQAVVVIHRREQHREQRERVDHAEARGQDVDVAAVDRDRQPVAPLAPSRPFAGETCETRAQPFGHQGIGTSSRI